MPGNNAAIMVNRVYYLNSINKSLHVLDLDTGKSLGGIQLGLPDNMQWNYVSEAIGVYDDLLLVGVNESIYGFQQPKAYKSPVNSSIIYSSEMIH